MTSVRHSRLNVGLLSSIDPSTTLASYCSFHRLSLMTKYLVLFAAALGLTVIGCNGDDPVSPLNRNPVILSLATFPDTLSRLDSAIVVCGASDPDADPLVYDWITDARLRLKGALPGDPFLYNTSANYQIIYHGNLSPPHDSAFVRCSVRDGRGGVVSQRIFIRLLNQ